MMANDILIKTLLLLNIVPLTLSLSTSEQILCSVNSTLLETTGDAIITVFVDANYGQYCNISSAEGLQQISTALYVVQTLNKYNYVPDVKLGLRVFDTCHNRTMVFKQTLRVAIEQICVPHEIGILVPSQYNPILSSLNDYGGISSNIYKKQNFTWSTIDILTHYLSIRYEVVDLVLANTKSVLDRFLEITRNAGVCVKRHDKHVNIDKDANVTEIVIVAIGERDDVQRWLKENEESKGFIETWFLLPLDNSDIDDLIPFGSYIIKPEIPENPFDLDEFSNVDEFLENSGDFANHSPYLLGIGKAIVELTKVLQDIRRNCFTNDNDDNDDDDDEDESCIVRKFRPGLRREIREFDVYEALRMQPKLHLVKYAVAMKTQSKLVNVAIYGIEVSKLRVLPETMAFETPNLCVGNLVGNCENCTNFQKRSDEHVITKADIVGKSVLKDSIYVSIFLIAIVCGILVCCVIVIFIVHRSATKKILDGNPIFTIILILANVFTMLTALPFCMADDYFGAENLNEWKILLTTLTFGFTFSIMFSKALFLILSTSGVFITHINGYLQSLIVFFVFGVQVAMSVMYFVLNTADSAELVRSPILIVLLGYDIFLLIALFIVCCVIIIKTEHNYHEGNCLFGTSISLLIIWTIWLICFANMHPKDRDTIVSFGIIGTAYLIILGVLIPRIYYMVMQPSERKNFEQRFGSTNLPPNSIVNTIIRQSYSSYDYVHAARETQTLRKPTYPNYYGSSPSPSSKRLDRCRSANHREMPEYSNYGFQAEMKQVDDVSVDNLPRICVENTESRRNDVIYAQPRIYRAQKVTLAEKSNSENIRNRNNSSPTSRLHHEMYPMRYASPKNMAREQKIDEENEDEEEEDEEDQEDQKSESVSRVTRF